MSKAAIDAARFRARAARETLSGDIATIGQRLHPAALAGSAAEAVVDRTRGRPVAIAGGAVVGLVILAVPPLRRLALRAACAGWRNRKTIGGLMALTTAVRSDRPNRIHRKDEP